ncbi:MAG: cytochrome ubiquinol oxidase subunit I, partial [Bacteroidales bacterium]|nr:cytochrome ubiquinol oxidase subunit I [Bacteroidales bacterium]
GAGFGRLPGKPGGGRRDGAAVEHRRILDENMAYFGYGYLDAPEDLIPNVPLNYYAFRVMVGLGMYFILFFALILFLTCRKDLSRYRWLLYVALFTIPLGYLAGQTGWIVAECGRQPWAIQDVLPVSAAVSDVGAGAVMTTFFLFLALFSVMLAVGISLMVKSVKKGPAMVESLKK